MNPFKYGNIVQDEFFTDRAIELERVKQAMDSENHLVLISPRRFGKSSLIRKALSQLNRPSITIDLMKVLSVSDLAAQLLKGVFGIYPLEKVKHIIAHFRILPTISMNPVSDALDVTFMPTQNSSVALEDALSLVEKVSTPEHRIIVVLDEFQEVNSIQKGLDRQLRSIMQAQRGINYIFLGSQESMMTEIFEHKKSPFYHFGQLMHLSKIPYDDFYLYIKQRLLDKPDCTAEEREAYMDSTVKGILAITKCHPYYTQQLASAVYNLMQYESCFDNVIPSAVNMLVSEHDLDYERLWLSMNLTDRKVLSSLAQAGTADAALQMRTSTAYSSINRLIKKGYVIKTETFEIEDPFFARWIVRR